MHINLFIHEFPHKDLWFIFQKEIEVTSYPEDLFEEQEHTDVSDIDVSGEQDYLCDEQNDNNVRSDSISCCQISRASIKPGMFRDVPKCSGTFRNVPECTVCLILSTLSNMLRRTCSVMMSNLLSALFYWL